METPNNLAGRLTAQIMLKIQKHLKDNTTSEHHYNRVCEAIYDSIELAQPKQGEGEETELQKVMNELSEWQDVTFPSATSLSKLIHLVEEVLELIDEINSSAISCPENTLVRWEYADCFMLLLGAAKKDGFTANDIIHAIREKHEIVKKRKWGKPDKNGVVKHI